jgi:hypothetical protein
MDSFKVSDEGGGIIRVDARTRLMRKPMAITICDEVDRVVADYDEFKILMNLGAISKGTPAAGLYVVGSMKKYPLRALALFGANGFMRGMAKTVLGLARFRNFELFQGEAIARDWLERADGATPTPGGGGTGDARAGRAALLRIALPASLLTSGALVARARRRHRRAAGVGSPTAG